MNSTFLSTLTTEELRKLNHSIIDEINRRTRSLRGRFVVGSRVTINDLRCAGRVYLMERTTLKTAVLREENHTGPLRTRATLSLLTLIS